MKIAMSKTTTKTIIQTIGKTLQAPGRGEKSQPICAESAQTRRAGGDGDKLNVEIRYNKYFRKKQYKED